MPDPKHDELTCLWMDLKSSVGVVDTPAAFTQRCRVVRSSGFDARAVECERPDFLVLEFDYPSRQDLARAATFKQQHSAIPMLVVTVQHSEALALWFMRARFYDFLVQPLAVSDVRRCFAAMEAIRRLRVDQPVRLAAVARPDVPLEAAAQSSDRARLQPALSIVERDYHQRLLVTEVAAKCGIPPFRFGRSFKEQFGLDFREYVLRYRIREACRLLRNPQASITEVGYSCGFSEPSYFARMFKKLVGCPPSEVVGRQELDFRVIEDRRA